MGEFKIQSKFKPTGDQPKAIDTLVQSIENGNRGQTLLGVTGSGKTFTMANIIERTQKPTLILAHNKTLAAQLCAEFKEFYYEKDYQHHAHSDSCLFPFCRMRGEGATGRCPQHGGDSRRRQLSNP